MVCFLCLLRNRNFCNGPRKFPQKCQKIAECWKGAVYNSRHPTIALKPCSSSPKRTGPRLDNTTSQPSSDVTCLCITSSSAYFSFVKLFLSEKIRESTKSTDGGTGTGCVRIWLTHDIAWTASIWRGSARFRGNRRSGTSNGALSTPNHLLALLWELSQCPARALT